MNPELLRRLRIDGFAIASLSGSALVRSLKREADWLVGRFTNDGYRSGDYWSFVLANCGEPVLYRIHNLERQGSKPIADLYTAGPLHDLAREVLSTPVHATACAMIVKVPFHAARVPWHRDRTSVRPHEVCNLSLFLDASSPGNGCMEFVPGSHLLPDDVDVIEVSKRGPVQPVPAAAGDVVVHDVRVVHSSGVNPGRSCRRSIIIEFTPAGFALSRKDG